MLKKLFNLQSEIEKIEKDIEKEKNKSKKLIESFLFLFAKSIYTDNREFNYEKRDSKFGGNAWFVNIRYYSEDKSIHVNTGIHIYKSINSSTEHDNPPDINKIRLAFKNVMEKQRERKEKELNYIKETNKVFRKLNN